MGNRGERKGRGRGIKRETVEEGNGIERERERETRRGGRITADFTPV